MSLSLLYSVCLLVRCCEKKEETNVLKEPLLYDSFLILTVGTVALCLCTETNTCPVTLKSVFLFGGWLQMEVLWIQTGAGLVQALANCGGCGRGTRGVS